MNDKFLSLLGMARRSGRVSLGHDAVIGSIIKNKAKLCILSSEASERLKKEIRHACTYENKNIPVIVTSYDILTLSSAIGSKAAVVSIDDEGFAKALQIKYGNQEPKEQ